MNISKTVADTAKVTINGMANRKSHISRVSEAITVTRMKTDPYCQQRNCSALNVLFSDVQTVLISQVVPHLWGVKQR